MMSFRSKGRTRTKAEQLGRTAFPKHSIEYIAHMCVDQTAFDSISRTHSHSPKGQAGKDTGSLKTLLPETLNLS